MLPASTRILGIDEHTAVVVDPAAGVGRVMGKGGVTLCQGDQDTTIPRGEMFDLDLLGPFHDAIPPADFVPELAAQPDTPAEPDLPEAALDLLKQRQAARANKDWARSDELRDTLAALGVAVQDTKDGQQWTVENG
jgi:hypothetical protein